MNAAYSCRVKVRCMVNPSGDDSDEQCGGVWTAAVVVTTMRV